MQLEEQVFRYPRWVVWPIEIVCTVLVALAAFQVGGALLRAAWSVFGFDGTFIESLPGLATAVAWIESPGRPSASTLLNSLPALVVPLAWFAAALFVALMLRNAFPAIRTSSQGMLVEFANDWVPVRWERLTHLKVTGEPSGRHFMLLVQTESKELSPYHRFYSFIWPSIRRGFFVSSQISNFQPLVKEILSQTSQAIETGERSGALFLDETRPSPLFQFLLSPAAFFARPAKAAPSARPAPAAAPVSASNAIRATYPTRIAALINTLTYGAAGIAALGYLWTWVRFLALELPFVRRVVPFSWTISDPRYVELFLAFRTQGVPLMGIPARPDLPVPLWLLISGHLAIFAALAALFIVRNILPNLEARPQGLAVQNMLNRQWKVVPWSTITAIKATDISEQSQIVLIQSNQLPFWGRFYSLLYDGSFQPGVLVTSAIDNFADTLRYAIEQVTPLEEGRPEPIIQPEGHSWLFWLASLSPDAMETLVDAARQDDETKVLSAPLLRVAASPAIGLALMPVFLLLANQILLQSSPPNGFTMIVAAFVLFLFCLLEWPVVSFLASAFDDSTGGGEEKSRVFLLYPFSQLPRILPLLVALLFILIGFPLLGILVWLGAIAWSYWLARRLWTVLYSWKESEAMIAGLISPIWQLIVLLIFLVLT